MNNWQRISLFFTIGICLVVSACGPGNGSNNNTNSSSAATSTVSATFTTTATTTSTATPTLTVVTSPTGTATTTLTPTITATHRAGASVLTPTSTRLGTPGTPVHGTPTVTSAPFFPTATSDSCLPITCIDTSDIGFDCLRVCMDSCGTIISTDLSSDCGG